MAPAPPHPSAPPTPHPLTWEALGALMLNWMDGATTR